MPTLRSRFIYNLPSNETRDVSPFHSATPMNAGFAKYAADASQQRIVQLQQERSDLTSQVRQQEQEHRALKERLHTQSQLLEQFLARCEHQRVALDTASSEKAFLQDRLIAVYSEKTRLSETSTKIQNFLLQEVRDLINNGIRLDVDDVLRGRAKISTKELDAQLDWHRVHRGRKIPRSGVKTTKLARWAKAIRDYTTEVEERIALIPVMGGGFGEDLGSAMSIDDSAQSYMDVDLETIV